MLNPTYSVIIPYHSNSSFLKICLQSLDQTLPPETEIVIVLNNENKKELELTINEERFRAIRINKNLGYAAATNLGAREAKGEYLIFCDSDTYFLPHWFEKICTRFHSNDKIACVSPKLLNPKTDRITDFGIGLSKYNNCHPFFDRPRDFQLTLEDRRVQMVCSAVMLIEKEYFFSLGGNDEDLGNYYTDVDLCLRINQNGKECWVVGDSFAYHQGSSSDLNRSPYRADIKGLYVAKNFNRMEVDMHKTFHENFQFYKERNTVENEYLLVDFSSIFDRKWHYGIIQEHLTIKNVYELGSADRDSEYISLINIGGSNLLLTKIPLLYFVDRFTSLRNNSLWSEYRSGMGDIVVDRHGNVVGFDQIMEA